VAARRREGEQSNNDARLGATLGNLRARKPTLEVAPFRPLAPNAKLFARAKRVGQEGAHFQRARPELAVRRPLQASFGARKAPFRRERRPITEANGRPRANLVTRRPIGPIGSPGRLQRLRRGASGGFSWPLGALGGRDMGRRANWAALWPFGSGARALCALCGLVGASLVGFLERANRAQLRGQLRVVAGEREQSSKGGKINIKRATLRFAGRAWGKF